MPLDNSFDDIFNEKGTQYGVDPLFLKAQAIYESKLNPKFKNPDSSAAGLTAFTDATAKDYDVNRDDPASSIDGQARYLVANYEKFKNNEDPVTAAVSAYKTGPNANTVDKKYVTDIMDIYKDLKSNSPAEEADPIDAILNKKLDSYRTVATPGNSPEDRLAVKLDSYRTPLPEKAPEKALLPKEELVINPTQRSKYDLSGFELADLKEKDPAAYTDYMSKKRGMARGETAYGLGDVPRSIANVAASVAPETFSTIARAAVPAYASLTGQPPPSPEDYKNVPTSQDAPAYKNALQERNAEFNRSYGEDPNASGNRLAGNILGSSSLIGSASKVLPAIPIAGSKLAQYTASGLNAARIAPVVTALTNASSNTSLGKQFGQNAVLSAALGAAAPAVYDLGVGTANMTKKLFSSGEDVLSTKAHGTLNKLVGDIDNLDTLEYVPGSKPTLAQAAASGGSKNAANVAALERTLGEANPNEAGGLTIPDLIRREQDNSSARRNFLDSITGSQDDLNTAYTLRSKNARSLLEGSNSIWKDAKAVPSDPSPVVNKINAILEGPDSGNEAVQSVLQKIRNKLVDAGGKTLPQAQDPEYLYRSGIKTINQWLEDRNTTDLGQLAKAAKPQVREIKTALDEVIKNSVPGYNQYLQKYAEDSIPINQMELLQKNLNFTNQPGPQGVPTLSKVDRAIEKINDLRSEPTLNEAKSLSEDQLDALNNLRKDLIRKEAPNKLLATMNSATDPKYAMRQKVKETLGMSPESAIVNPRSLGAAAGAGIASAIPLPIPGKYAAGAYLGERAGEGVSTLLRRSHEGVQNKLVDMMLNPSTYSQQAPISLLSNFKQTPMLQDFLGTAVPYGAVGANRLLSGAQ